MTIIYKTKTQIRVETESEVEKFLRSGGIIEVIKSRKAPKQRMSGKTTRVGSTGTGGFAVGFPSKCFV